MLFCNQNLVVVLPGKPFISTSKKHLGRYAPFALGTAIFELPRLKRHMGHSILKSDP